MQVFILTQQLRDTTLGENRLTLDDATRDLSRKYLLGGISNLKHEHYIRVALLV